LPGRLVVTQNQDVDISVLLNNIAAHLFWRIMQLNHEQPSKLFYFLLFTRSDVTKHSKELRSTHKRLRRKVDATKCFFDEVMCYKVIGPKRVECLLKPNRTPEYHLELTRLMTRMTLSFLLITVIIAIPVIPYLFETLVLDKSYLRAYPKCNEELELLNSYGIVDEDSITIDWWRLSSLVADAIENTLFWLEIARSGLCGIELCTLLNQDLTYYWDNIHDQALGINGRLERISLLARTGLDLLKLSSLENKDKIFYWGGRIDRISTKESLESEIDELHNEVQKLLSKIHDFHKDVKDAGNYISDVLTLTLGIWFASFPMYFYLLNKDGRLMNDYQYQIVLGIPMLCIVTTHSLILRLYRRCIKTYPILCSIMAQHRHRHQKSSFMPVLDYFNENLICYKIIRWRPFLPGSLLSILGWCYSCFFIVSNMQKNLEIV